MADTRSISITDLGKGGAVNPNQNRTIADVARKSVSPRWKCQVLARMASWWQPGLIVELGTSLGISSAYLAVTCPSTPVITVDGSEELHNEAVKGWSQLGITNIDPITLPFQAVLKTITWKKFSQPLIYLDGDHHPDHVHKILQFLATHCPQPFMVIIDDIRWSREMWTGWNEWSSEFQTSVWIDLFQLGVWICDPAVIQSQHQTLIPSRFKPLRLGWL